MAHMEGSNPLAPTNSSENLQNPGCQVPRFLSRIAFAEPSGRCFKSGLHPESFEISRLRRSRLVYPAHFSKQSATLDATRLRGRTLIHEADD
jgi:hypothetical protein